MNFAGLQDILKLAHGVGVLISLKKVILIRESPLGEDLSNPGQPLNTFIETLLQTLANSRNRFDKVVLIDSSSSIRLQK